MYVQNTYAIGKIEIKHCQWKEFVLFRFVSVSDILEPTDDGKDSQVNILFSLLSFSLSLSQYDFQSSTCTGYIPGHVHVLGYSYFQVWNSEINGSLLEQYGFILNE